MFLNGQKVVCIDDTFTAAAHRLYIAFPVNGKVYVVRGMAPGVALDCRTDEVAVYLVGLVNPCSGRPPFREFCFRAERFRPLDELTERDIVGEQEPNYVGFTA
jgi:hypothetical protein